MIGTLVLFSSLCGPGYIWLMMTTSDLLFSTR